MKYKITIYTDKQGEKPLVLSSDSRTNCRFATKLCEENGLRAVTTEEREPRVAPFKNM